MELFLKFWNPLILDKNLFLFRYWSSTVTFLERETCWLRITKSQFFIFLLTKKFKLMAGNLSSFLKNILQPLIMEQLFVIAQNYVHVFCFVSVNMISARSATTFWFFRIFYINFQLGQIVLQLIFSNSPSRCGWIEMLLRRQKMCNTSKIFKWRYAVSYWLVNSFLFGIYKMTFTFHQLSEK